MYIKWALPIVCIFSLFGVSGALLIAGITTQASWMFYASGGFSVVGLASACYVCVRDRPRQIVFEAPAFPPRLYKDPGMKKNKSDTNLELMGTVKTTTDEGEITSDV